MTQWQRHRYPASILALMAVSVGLLVPTPADARMPRSLVELTVAPGPAKAVAGKGTCVDVALTASALPGFDSIFADMEIRMDLVAVTAANPEQLLASDTWLAGPSKVDSSDPTVSSTRRVCTGANPAVRARFHVVAYDIETGIGRTLTTRDILVGKVPPPAPASPGLVPPLVEQDKALDGSAVKLVSRQTAQAKPVLQAGASAKSGPGGLDQPGAPAPAAAASSTGGSWIGFSGTWSYHELRTNCNNSPASRFPCSAQNTWRPMKGARVEIWRQRLVGSLLYLTKVCTISTQSDGTYGGFCGTDWLSGDEFKARIVLERRDGSYGNADWRWRVLADGALPWGDTTWQPINSNGIVQFGSWVIYGAEARIYASLQDTFSVFGSAPQVAAGQYHLNVNHFERPDPAYCPVDSTLHNINLCHRPGDDSVAANGDVASHEFGHVLHRVATDDHVYFDYNFGNSSEHWHSIRSAEWEETVQVEGWANFVAAATYYGPSASSPTFYGYPVSQLPAAPGSPTCYQCVDGTVNYPGNRCEGNSMMFFWDAYDTVNDDAWPDGATMSPSELIDVFAAFPAGTTNRHRDEGDLDGPNAWDYYWISRYGTQSVHTPLNNEVWSNCLNQSDWN